MVTPYSLQSPEDIAKEYGGNKQKIMAAAQAGVVDPTAAVVAGMFIDRMRAAAQQEMAGAPTTVAQDTFAPPMPPAGGLGGMAPQGAPQMQPPMAAPAVPAPEGGIGGLDFAPAQMAGGGIVGYADGGTTGGWGDYIEQTVLSLDPNIQISGRGRTPTRNAQVGGVPNSYHLIDAARDIRTPEGMEKSEFIAQLKSVFGPDYDILPSEGRSVHIEPGPALGEKVRGGRQPSNMPATMPERDIYTAEGRAASLSDLLGVTSQYLGGLPREQRDRLMAEAEKELDPEVQKKRKEEDLYFRLADFGFKLASSTAPSILSSISEAAAATFPGVKADAETRKEAKEKALSKLMAFEEMDRKTATEALSLAIDLRQQDMTVEQAESDLAVALRKLEQDAEQFKQTLGLQQDELAVERMKARGGLTTEDAVKEAKERLAAYESGAADPEVAALAKKYGEGGRSNLLADLTRSIQAEYAAIMGVPATGFGAPPEGAVRKVK